MDAELTKVWEAIDKGGTIAVSLFVILAFLRGWIVPRWAYLELKERCTQLTQVADRATELAERLSLALDELKRHRR